MSFTEAIQTCFRKYAVFSGRARRSEYWWWVLFNILVVFGLAMFAAGSESTESGIGVLFGIAWLALVLPTLAVTVRRLHDTGRSGWWWFISFVPLVGPIVMIVFMATAGDPGANQYGAAPAHGQRSTA